MEAKEIKKIKEYLKNLKMLEFKEWVYMPEDYKIRLPEYIGKNVFWFIWKNWNYSIEAEKGAFELSFSSPPLTVKCKMKGLYCVDAYGFNDDPYEEPEPPTTNKIRTLHASLLLSPLVTKEDLISIFDVNIQNANSSLIQSIIK